MSGGDSDAGVPPPKEVNNIVEAQPKVEQPDPFHDLMNRMSPDQMRKDFDEAAKRGGTSNDADKILGTVGFENPARQGAGQDSKFMATTRLLEKTEGTEPYKPTETAMFDQVRQHFAQQVQNLNNFTPKIANA
jgi:hypothetical protein